MIDENIDKRTRPIIEKFNLGRYEKEHLKKASSFQMVLASQIWEEAYVSGQKDTLEKVGFLLDKVDVDKKLWYIVKDWRDKYLIKLRGAYKISPININKGSEFEKVWEDKSEGVSEMEAKR